MRKKEISIILCVLFFSVAFNIFCLSNEVFATESTSDTTVQNSVNISSNPPNYGGIYTSLIPGKTVYGMRFGVIENASNLFDLSDNEAFAIVNGKDINLTLESKIIDESTDSMEDINYLYEAINNSDINGIRPGFIDYLDISLYKEIQGQYKSKTKINETKVPVPLVIKNPASNIELKENYRRDIYFFRVENDVVFLNGPFNIVDDYINFSLQKFGTIAMTYIDVYVGENYQSNNSFTPNKGNTTVKEIKDKIDNFSGGTIGNYYVPISNIETRIEDNAVTTEEIPDNNSMPTVITKKSMSVFSIFMIIFIVDLILIGGYILISSVKRNKAIDIER